MNFEEFVRDNKYCYALPKGMALWKMEARRMEIRGIVQTDMHSILLILQGELEIEVEGHKYLLSKNSWGDIIGERQIKLLSASKDLVAWQLLMTDPFLVELFKNKPPFPPSYALDRKKQPIYMLDIVLVRRLQQKFEDIECVFRETTHYFQAEMLQYTLMMLMMDVANAYYHQMDQEEENVDMDRKRELFLKFMKLLTVYIRKEHTVNFYASKLCVTPQYLARVVRNCSGRTVYEMITMLLVSEIACMLEQTELSVQQIADELNITDQSTLTKLFKRQKGVSPTEYRKGYRG